MARRYASAMVLVEMPSLEEVLPVKMPSIAGHSKREKKRKSLHNGCCQELPLSYNVREREKAVVQLAAAMLLQQPTCKFLFLVEFFSGNTVTVSESKRARQLN